MLLIFLQRGVHVTPHESGSRVESLRIILHLCESQSVKKVSVGHLDVSMFYLDSEAVEFIGRGTTKTQND